MKWFKSLGIWAILGGGFIAAMMIMNARRAGAMETQVEWDESKIKKLKRGSAYDIHEAKKLQSDIAVKKVKAREVRKKSEAQFERIGQDETINDIATRFNNKRVRRRKNKPA